MLDTFASLVSINMSLPYRIQRLTGIRPDELRSAPPLSSLHGQLRTFLGDAPLVGHNVGFDVAFLQKVGLARRNPLIDTWELASLLLPNQPNYSLGALGEALGIPADVHHRALADAQLTRELFLLLLQRSRPPRRRWPAPCATCPPRPSGRRAIFYAEGISVGSSPRMPLATC